MKKAQGMSLSVIVIAILALLVLVVLAAIFIGKTGQSVAGFDDCENKGGKCGFESCGPGWIAMPNLKCPEQGQICCIPITTQ